MEFLKTKEILCHQSDFKWCDRLCEPSHYTIWLIKQELRLTAYYDDCYFAVANLTQGREKVDVSWSVVHLPSRTVIAADLKKKSDAVCFIENLSKIIDIKSFDWLTTDYSSIAGYLNTRLDIVYKNYLYQVSQK